MNYRIEKDSMGEMRVPENAYYGAQTQRAVENFPISCFRFSRCFISAMGEIKRAAAQIAQNEKYIDSSIAKAIIQAATEVIEGKFDEQFVVDVFQTGSGTSTNMNTNEIIANRATEILGGKRGSKMVHPNDHVNFGQSSNDVFPTAMHLAILHTFVYDLIPTLKNLMHSLQIKTQQFDSIVKIGRTHLQDATPIRMGQVFSGYAAQVEYSVQSIQRVLDPLYSLALGGTAVGTGINSPKGFAKKVIQQISQSTQWPLKEAANHFAWQSGKEAVVEASGALRVVSVALMKIANDIRWLASGPRCGIGELRIPSTQPGSSMMPGKVNPVIVESLIMVCAQVIGNDLTVTIGGNSGNFELNVMMPVMIFNVLQSSELLTTASENFQKRCIEDLEVDEQRSTEMIEKSLALCTALALKIGYDQAALIAKEAFSSGKTVREVAKQKKILSDEELNRILDPIGMTKPY